MRFFFLLAICFCWKGECYEEALQKLIDGNRRFAIGGELRNPRLSVDVRERLRKSQEPFAVVLACADSRVAPELIFDQGLGDLFVVRIAGNIAASTELESINYAVVYLHAKVIMVLGHQNCGAVAEVLDGNGSELPEIASWIEPAIRSDNQLSLEQAVKKNVQSVVAYLKSTTPIAEYIAQQKIEVVGGYYHLDDGKVEILPSIDSNQ